MSFPQEEHPQPKQKFTGYWIPVELSKMELTKTEQFLLAMIDSLEEDAPNYCFASNAYLAKQMELSESRISFYLTKFKRMGLIEEVGFDGRRRRIKTCKERWYSRKELCVTASSQTTRTHEPRVRDSTIPPIYIEEDNDDDDRVCEEDEKILITKDSKGREKKSSIPEMTRYLRGCKYPDETIQEAIKRTQTFPDPISNALRFVESICIQIEAQNAKITPAKPSKKQKEIFTPRPVIEQKTITWEEFQKNKKQGK
jgi:DNA-binding Lrp family transcriptional regulator